MDRRDFIRKSLIAGAGAAACSLTLPGCSSEDRGYSPENTGNTPDTGDDTPASGQWSTQQAQQWWKGQEWPVGTHYIPAYAINQYEFWQADTFDEVAVDNELTSVTALGFNVIRIYLHEDLWHLDKTGFKSRIDKVLDMADKKHIKVTFTFCTNGGGEIPVTPGPQPEPQVGMAYKAWVQSPSTDVLNNSSRWDYFKEYLQDILSTYADDDRILYWCLYNEPENIKDERDPIGFLPSLYKWAWEVRPSQPLTSPVWLRPGYKTVKTRLDIMSFICSNSDILTFHCYYDADELSAFISMLRRFNRPLICQEFYNKAQGSTLESFLPILKREKVGALLWNFQHGKANSHPELSGTSCYSAQERELIREHTADKSTAGQGSKL
ncbi:MAG: cellulase family glycosylhydrolase [Bacteroidales bacterium]|nr:cellulase family glycosylhydrolase [Bacteroidales bacterium]